jgi:hypothetical protein
VWLFFFSVGRVSMSEVVVTFWCRSGLVVVTIWCRFGGGGDGFGFVFGDGGDGSGRWLRWWYEIWVVEVRGLVERKFRYCFCTVSGAVSFVFITDLLLWWCWRFLLR